MESVGLRFIVVLDVLRAPAELPFPPLSHVRHPASICRVQSATNPITDTLLLRIIYLSNYMRNICDCSKKASILR